MAIVENLMTGKNVRVCSVIIQTRNGVTDRLVKLYDLELSDNSNVRMNNSADDSTTKKRLNI